jgi:hypothetical protein
MIIFIPVLIICLNGTCEFMQAKTYYLNEVQCRASLDVQKQHMRNIAEQAGASRIEHLEGTCIDADVKTRTRTEVDA